jgi:hypothetical protein
MIGASRTLEITTKIGCKPNMCEYCPQDLLMARYKDVPNNETYMSMETFIQCLKSVPSYVDIHFTGYVESFLNPKTPDMILHAHSRNHRIAINTTLMGMTQKKLDLITNIPYKAFRIHLPSATYKEKIGYHSKSIIENGFTITLNPKWIKMLDYVIKKNIHQKVFHCHGKLHEQLVELGYLDKINVKDTSLQSRVQNVGNLDKERNEMTKLPSHLSKRGKCIRVYHNVLLPSGQVQLCCQDYGLEMTIGNLLENTLGEIQTSEKFLDIVKYGHDICDYCDVGIRSISEEESWEDWRDGVNGN